MSARPGGAAVALGLAASALLACAPGASANLFTGHVDGVTVGAPSPSRSLTGLDVTYDDAAGSLSGTATFAAPPSTGAPATLAIALGTPSGSNCGPPQAIMGSELDGSGAASAFLSPSTDALPASQSYGGTSVTLSATVAQYQRLPFRCVYALVRDGSNAVLSQTDGWRLVVDRTPPPPPAPPAPPTPPAPPAPAPKPPKVKPVPQLALRVTGVPKVAKRKRWITVRVRVSNPGTATTKRVKLQVRKASGVTAAPRSASLKSLKAGEARTVKLRLRRSASRSRTVRLLATGSGKAKATATIKLLDRAPRSKKPKPGKPADKGPLAGRYFWGFKSHADYAWDNYGAYFVDGQWAYYGLPAGGLPSCTKETATLDDKGQPTGEGCFRYSYDPASGNLTIGQHAGTFTGGKLVLDDIAMYPLTVPAAGSRFQVNLVHRGFRGLCGLIGGCTTTSESLALANDGQFVRSSSSLSTLGDGYATPFVAAGRYPPDQYGTYQVLAGGRIQLSYADGSVKVQTIGIEQNPAGGPDPANEGLLLDGTNFYKDSD